MGSLPLLRLWFQGVKSGIGNKVLKTGEALKETRVTEHYSIVSLIFELNIRWLIKVSARGKKNVNTHEGYRLIRTRDATHSCSTHSHLISIKMEHEVDNSRVGIFLKTCYVSYFLLCFSFLLPPPPPPHLCLARPARHSSIALRPLSRNSCRLQLCASLLCSLLVRYRYSFTPPLDADGCLACWP